MANFFGNASTINVILNIVAVLLSGGLVAAFLAHRLGWRGQTLGDEVNIRDHYAKEVTRLSEKLDKQASNFREAEKHWREMLEASNHRHEECEKARAESRAEMNAMHETQDEMRNEIRGLKDQLRQYSTDTLIMLERNGRPSESAPESLKAAERLKDRDNNNK